MKESTLLLVFDWAELMVLSALQNMLLVSRLIAEAALMREESRGVHCRTDFPETDDAHWKARIILRSYLGLSRAPATLAGFFAVALGVLALVAASFLIFPTPARVSGGPNAIAATFAGGNE